MGNGFHQEEHVRKKTHTKLVCEGKYAAEITVELIETDDTWSPYLSLEDAYRLDDVRERLRAGDIEGASRFGKVSVLTRVTA